MSVFGVSQVLEYYNKTGKDTLSIKRMAKALGISESSAKRYIHEAVKLGVLEQVRKGTYRIDREKAELFVRLSKAKDIREAALEIIGAIASGGRKREDMIPLTIFIPKQYLKHIEFILKHSVRGGELESIGDQEHRIYVLKVIREQE